MIRAYILVYSDAFGTREQAKEFLNSMPEVARWRYDMDHCFYLVADVTAQSLADKLRKLSGGKGRFLVTEYHTNSQGWLTNESWYLLNNLKYMPKK